MWPFCDSRPMWLWVVDWKKTWGVCHPCFLAWINSWSDFCAWRSQAGGAYTAMAIVDRASDATHRNNADVTEANKICRSSLPPHSCWDSWKSMPLAQRWHWMKECYRPSQVWTSVFRTLSKLDFCTSAIWILTKAVLTHALSNPVPPFSGLL